MVNLVNCIENGNLRSNSRWDAIILTLSDENLTIFESIFPILVLPLKYHTRIYCFK